MEDEVPLSQVVYNIVCSSREGYVDLFEQLDESFPLRQRELFVKFFEIKRQQLVRLLVLVKWIKKSGKSLSSLKDMIEVIQKRDIAWNEAVQRIHSLAVQVESRMYPVWDVDTSLHVLSTGSYELLPRAIDHEIRPHKLTKKTDTEIVDRLSNLINFEILASELPADVEIMDVKEGILYLQMRDTFEAGLTLRCELSEEDDIPTRKWTLCELELHLSVSASWKEEDEIDGTPARFKSCNTSVINSLIAPCSFINESLNNHPQPLSHVCTILSGICSRMILDVLYEQLLILSGHTGPQKLQQGSRFARDMNVQYDAVIGHHSALPSSKHLSLSYWPHAFSLTTDRKEDECSKLTLCVDSNKKIKVSHYPNVSYSALLDNSMHSVSLENMLLVDPSQINASEILEMVSVLHGNMKLVSLWQMIQSIPPFQKLKLTSVSNMKNSYVSMTPIVAINLVFSVDRPNYDIVLRIDHGTGQLLIEGAFHSFSLLATLALESPSQSTKDEDHIVFSNRQIRIVKCSVNRIAELLHSIASLIMREKFRQTLQRKLALNSHSLKVEVLRAHSKPIYMGYTNQQSKFGEDVVYLSIREFPMIIIVVEVPTEKVYLTVEGNIFHSLKNTPFIHDVSFSNVNTSDISVSRSFDAILQSAVLAPIVYLWTVLHHSPDFDVSDEIVSQYISDPTIQSFPFRAVSWHGYPDYHWPINLNAFFSNEGVFRIEVTSKGFTDDMSQQLKTDKTWKSSVARWESSNDGKVFVVFEYLSMSKPNIDQFLLDFRGFLHFTLISLKLLNSNNNDTGDELAGATFSAETFSCSHVSICCMFQSDEDASSNGDEMAIETNYNSFMLNVSRNDSLHDWNMLNPSHDMLLLEVSPINMFSFYLQRSLSQSICSHSSNPWHAYSILLKQMMHSEACNTLVTTFKKLIDGFDHDLQMHNQHQHINTNRLLCKPTMYITASSVNCLRLHAAQKSAVLELRAISKNQLILTQSDVVKKVSATDYSLLFKWYYISGRNMTLQVIRKSHPILSGSGVFTPDSKVSLPHGGAHGAWKKFLLEHPVLLFFPSNMKGSVLLEKNSSMSLALEKYFSRVIAIPPYNAYHTNSFLRTLVQFIDTSGNNTHNALPALRVFTDLLHYQMEVHSSYETMLFNVCFQVDAYLNDFEPMYSRTDRILFITLCMYNKYHIDGEVSFLPIAIHFPVQSNNPSTSCVYQYFRWEWENSLRKVSPNPLPFNDMCVSKLLTHILSLSPTTIQELFHSTMQHTSRLPKKTIQLLRK